ncbi:MAG: hypothetical protein HPZ91_19655 [Lentisphaeria bacterium]|nr:hypothetical protein [Lentisphaeria bacterium]
MSKIQDIIEQIGSFLDSDDRSMTPRLARLAADYAEGCRQLNRELAECGNVLRSSTLRQAQKFNVGFQPPLTDRFRLLNFPLRDEWCDICRLYNLELPPKLDTETVERLLNSDEERERTAAALIAEWPETARHGSLARQLNLLRRILAVATTGCPTWQNNLTEVEKRYLAELGRDTEEALARNDLERLEAICRELNSPELRSTPDPALMEKLRRAVRSGQEQRMEQRQNALLDQLQAAYAAMDAALLGQLLEEWRKLLTDPLAAPDENARTVIREIEQFLDGRRREAAQQQEFERLRTELLVKLDDNAPFAEIDRLYQSLRLLDRPIEGALVRRVETLTAEARLEAARRHIRHTVYGITAALLLTGATAIALLAYQYRRTLSSSVRSMQKLIEEGNPAGALALYDKLQQESPRVAGTSRITALKEQALNKRTAAETERLNTSREFEFLASELSPLLTAAGFSPSRASGLLAEGEKLQNRLTDAERVRFLAFKSEFARLTEERKKAQEKKFSDAAAKLIAMLQAPGATAELLENTVKQFNELLRGSKGSVEPAILENSRSLFERRSTALRNRLDREKSEQELLRALTAPDEIYSYLDALARVETELPAQAPEFARARALLPLYRAMTSADFVDSTPPDDWRPESAATYLGPRQLDLMQYARPEPDLKALTAEFDRKLKSLADLFTAPGDFYELAFRTADGRQCFFYAEEQPRAERTRSTQDVREITLDTVLEPGRLGTPTVIKVTRSGNSWRFSVVPGFLDKIRFPAEFTELAGWDPLKPEEFPKPAHLRFLEATREKIARAKSHSELENLVLRQLRQLTADTAMNPYQQKALFRQLLTMLPRLSHFYASSAAYAESVRQAPEEEQPEWYNPAAYLDAEHEIASFREGLAEFPAQLDRLQEQRTFLQRFYKALLSRRISAAAVVVRKDGGFMLHRFRKPQPQELFLLTRFRTGEVETDRLLPLPERVWADAADLEGELGGNCFPGQVLYCSDSLELTPAFFAKWQEEASKLNPDPVLSPALKPLNIP